MTDGSTVFVVGNISGGGGRKVAKALPKTKDGKVSFFRERIAAANNKIAASTRTTNMQVCPVVRL